MAQVQFPSGPVDGATYTVNDVTYTWSATNSLWTANNSTDLNSLFVAVAGDTMTGDLVANTTGALTIPTGTEAQKPGAPLAGATRLNTTSGSTEIYTGATMGWKDLAYVQTPATLPADLTYSADATVGGVIECNNLTIDAGVTLTLNQKGVIFKVYGDAIINGTIEGRGLGAYGGGGAGTLAQPGEALSTNGAAGQGFGSLAGIGYPPAASLLGSGGYSGYSTSGSSAAANYVVSGAGGRSGGSIVIRCYGSITMSGAINAVGQDGQFGTYGFGDTVGFTGSGGGSGGAVILHSDGPLNYTGTISVDGGAGGAPWAAGSFLTNNTLYSGGGGGGGWVILQTLSTLTNSGTTTLTGGNGGGASVGTGGGQLGGSPGASFSGMAGVSAAAGSAGQLIFTGSLF